MRTILLLTISNVFMTFAWYGHLKFHARPMWMIILVSWGIAFFEYCFQVPANRIGAFEEGYSATQLKILQEFITLVVFCVFSILYLGVNLKWNHYLAFGLVLGAVFLAQLNKDEKKPDAPSADPVTATAAANDPSA